MRVPTRCNGPIIAAMLDLVAPLLITFAIFVTETINFLKCICHTYARVYSSIHVLLEMHFIHTLWAPNNNAPIQNQSDFVYTQCNSLSLSDSKMQFWRFILTLLDLYWMLNCINIKAMSQCNQCLYAKINWYSVCIVVLCVCECAWIYTLPNEQRANALNPQIYDHDNLW